MPRIKQDQISGEVKIGDIPVKFSDFVPEGKVIIFDPKAMSMNTTNPCGEISLGASQSTVFMHSSFLESRKADTILKKANEWVKNAKSTKD